MKSIISWLTGTPQNQQSLADQRNLDPNAPRDEEERLRWEEEDRRYEEAVLKDRVNVSPAIPRKPSKDFLELVAKAKAEEQAGRTVEAERGSAGEEAKAALFEEIKNIVESASGGQGVVGRGDLYPDLLTMQINGEDVIDEKHAHSVRFILRDDGSIRHGFDLRGAKTLNAEETAKDLLQIAAWHLARHS